MKVWVIEEAGFYWGFWKVVEKEEEAIRLCTDEFLKRHKLAEAKTGKDSEQGSSYVLDISGEDPVKGRQRERYRLSLKEVE